MLFTLDGKELISVSDDKTIRVWDATSGEPLRVLRPPVGDDREGMLFAAALSPDGRRLAVGGIGPQADRYGSIYLLSLSDGEIEQVLTGHSRTINDLAFSADGRWLISGSLDKTARVWDMGQPKPDASSAKDGAALVLAGHTAAIGGVTFSPDGQWAATASFDGTVRVFELGQVKGEKRTLSAVVVLQGHSAEVHCIDWSPDGRWIATGSTDEAVRLWDAEKVKTEGRSGKGEPVSLKAERTVEGLGKQRILSVRFAPDSGRVLWTGGGLGGGTVCGLIDVATGTVNVRFTEHTNSVLHGSLAPDGQLAATADASGEILLWRTADGTRVRKLVGNARVTWAAAWSNDGNTVAWGNTNSGGGIKADAPLERAFDLSRLAFMEFKSQISDPKSQISNSKSDGGWRRAQFRLGSTTLESSGETTVDVLRSGTRQSTLQFEDDYSHKYNTVRSFTLLPGDRAAVGANYGLSLFDTRTGKRLRHFVGHTGVVRAVSPSPDNRYLLTASNDMTVRVWVPDQEQPLVSLFFAGDEWVAWTPEGYFAASPGGESLMGWHLNNGPDKLASFFPAGRFRKELYKPDLIKLLLRTGSVERALESLGKQKTEVAQVLPPSVVITSPEGGRVTVDTAEITVRAVAQQVGTHPVTSMQLLLDGRPLGGPGGVRHLSSPQRDATERFFVPLQAGQTHRIEVRADSAVSYGLSKTLEVTFKKANNERQLPSLYVLAIGVKDYEQKALSLRYADEDARRIDRTFKQYGKGLFQKVETKLIVNSEATQRGILKGLGWLRSQMTQHDVGVVFYSGHGDRDGAGAFYLMPHDVDPTQLLATGVPDSQLKGALKGTPGRLLLLLDACHAGAANGDKRKGDVALTDELVSELATDDYGVYVMASSMGREFSLESSDLKAGYFTLALTEGLSGKADVNSDKAIYSNELDTYVSERVKSLSNGQQHPVTAKPGTIRSFPLARQP